MSTAGSFAKWAAQVGGRNIRRRSGPYLYLSMSLYGFRFARRFLGRRQKSLLITELKPGQGLSIRALRRGE